jgi:plasmid stability protein
MAKTPRTEAALKHTTIRLPEDLLKRARIYAVEHGTSLQALIIEGLAARLESKRLSQREAKK